ncbi:hypothetical protein [Ilumatobacter sp.]|uniref:hypothetical protein n=1 Tax=Ilumatobacter sp. TaxID=1967498 RepID=UPI003C5FD55E
MTATGAVIVALTACGSGSDGAGDDSSTEAFCDQLRTFIETPADDTAVAVEQFDQLVEDAPDEVSDDLQVMSDAFSEVADLDEDDPESFTVLLEVFGRSDVIEAAETLEQYGADQCGLEPSPDADVDGGVDSVVDSGDDDAGDGGT